MHGNVRDSMTSNFAILQQLDSNAMQHKEELIIEPLQVENYHVSHF